jgi:hypothetical protein
MSRQCGNMSAYLRHSAFLWHYVAMPHRDAKDVVPYALHLALSRTRLKAAILKQKVWFWYAVIIVLLIDLEEPPIPDQSSAELFSGKLQSEQTTAAALFRIRVPCHLPSCTSALIRQSQILELRNSLSVHE